MRALVFYLTDQDEERERELTLNGVIDGKLATGDYIEMENPTAHIVQRKLLALISVPPLSFERPSR